MFMSFPWLLTSNMELHDIVKEEEIFSTLLGSSD